MHVLDLLFERNKWYRKLCGGKWYGYYLNIHVFIWERGEVPTNLTHFGTIILEDYTKEQ